MARWKLVIGAWDRRLLPRRLEASGLVAVAAAVLMLGLVASLPAQAHHRPEHGSQPSALPTTTSSATPSATPTATPSASAGPSTPSASPAPSSSPHPTPGATTSGATLPAGSCTGTSTLLTSIGTCRFTYSGGDLDIRSITMTAADLGTWCDDRPLCLPPRGYAMSKVELTTEGGRLLGTCWAPGSTDVAGTPSTCETVIAAPAVAVGTVLQCSGTTWTAVTFICGRQLAA